MAVVALTDAEKITLKSDTVLADTYKQKITNKAGYLKGVESGDTTWAKSRHWAAVLENNPSVLQSDNDLIYFLIQRM